MRGQGKRAESIASLYILYLHSTHHLADHRYYPQEARILGGKANRRDLFHQD